MASIRAEEQTVLLTGTTSLFCPYCHSVKVLWKKRLQYECQICRKLFRVI